MLILSPSNCVSCPQRRGIIYFVSEYIILESDLLNPKYHRLSISQAREPTRPALARLD